MTAERDSLLFTTTTVSLSKQIRIETTNKIQHKQIVGFFCFNYMVSMKNILLKKIKFILLIFTF